MVSEVDDISHGNTQIKLGCMMEMALWGIPALRSRDGQKKKEDIFVSLILLTEYLQVPHTVRGVVG